MKSADLKPYLSVHATFWGAVVLIAMAGCNPRATDRTGEEPGDNADSGHVVVLDTVLFDGTNLDKFRGYGDEETGEGWKIDGETLHFDGTGGGDIITKSEYSDFELHFDWKVSEGANSGVMYRVSLGDSAPYITGPEYQILDDANHGDGQNAETSAASLYGLVAPEGSEVKPVGEWNSAKIVLDGDLIEHWLNGKKVVSIEIGSDEWKQRLAASKFSDWEKFASNDRGHIAFQDHGDEVWFRNIRIRPVDGGE